MTRNILGTEPRVTRFKINWDDSEQQTSSSNGMQTTSSHENEEPDIHEMNDVSSMLSLHADNSLSQSPMEVL